MFNRERENQIMNRKLLVICTVVLLLLLVTACSRNEDTNEEELFREALETITNQFDVQNPLQTPSESLPPSVESPASGVPDLGTDSEELRETVNLGLQMTVQERTFGSLRFQRVRITTDGTLQRATGTDWETIATDVRSFAIREDPTAILYIANDNTLWGQGSNTNGLLGDGTGVDRAEPVHILDNVASVYFVGNSAYAIQTDRTLKTWGIGNFSPVEFASDVVRVDSVRCGMVGMVAMFQTSEGHVYRVERDGSTTQLLPDTVFAVSHNIATGFGPFSGVYYINANHVLIRRNYRQDNMGRARFVDEEEIATDVLKLFNFTVVDRMSNTFFITSDGTLWARGSNQNGQLGDGTRVPRTEPVRIAENVVYVRPFMFLQNDGTLWAWNQNDPTPQPTHYNVAHIGDGFIHFQDGRLLQGNREFEDIKVPRTLTFE